MRQGEIYDVSLDPVVGREQSGRRPAIIISGNYGNEILQVVTVIPLTTKILPKSTNLIIKANHRNGLPEKSSTLVHQIRSVSKTRIHKHWGTLTQKELNELKQLVLDYLTY